MTWGFGFEDHGEFFGGGGVVEVFYGLTRRRRVRCNGRRVKSLFECAHLF